MTGGRGFGMGMGRGMQNPMMGRSFGSGFGRSMQSPMMGRGMQRPQAQGPMMQGRGFGQGQGCPMCGQACPMGRGPQGPMMGGRGFGMGQGRGMQGPMLGGRGMHSPMMQGQGFGRGMQSPMMGRSFGFGFGRSMQSPMMGRGMQRPQAPMMGGRGFGQGRGCPMCGQACPMGRGMQGPMASQRGFGMGRGMQSPMMGRSQGFGRGYSHGQGRDMSRRFTGQATPWSRGPQASKPPVGPRPQAAPQSQSHQSAPQGGRSIWHKPTAAGQDGKAPAKRVVEFELTYSPELARLGKALAGEAGQKLELTADQREKIHAIVAGYREQMANMKQRVAGALAGLKDGELLAKSEELVGNANRHAQELGRGAVGKVVQILTPEQRRSIGRLVRGDGGSEKAAEPTRPSRPEPRQRHRERDDDDDDE